MTRKWFYGDIGWGVTGKCQLCVQLHFLIYVEAVMISYSAVERVINWHQLMEAEALSLLANTLPFPSFLPSLECTLSILPVKLMHF